MSYPSQVSMSELHSYMTPSFILNAFEKQGHRPVSAEIKKRKNDDKDICILQFVNSDAAKQAVLKLNGKAIPNAGYSNAKFKLSQCAAAIPDYTVWVGDLSLDVDEFRLFKFFANHFKSLCHAKIVTDSTRGVSRGYGFLKFANEEDQKHCLRNMGGKQGLGHKPIKVALCKDEMIQSQRSSDSGTNDKKEGLSKESEITPWMIYTSWNQASKRSFELPFHSLQRRKLPQINDDDPNRDLRLIDYNVPLSTDDLNKEMLERDRYFWDALECTSWLPTMAFDYSTTTKAPAQKSTTTSTTTSALKAVETTK